MKLLCTRPLQATFLCASIWFLSRYIKTPDVKETCPYDYVEGRKTKSMERQKCLIMPFYPNTITLYWYAIMLWGHVYTLCRRIVTWCGHVVKYYGHVTMYSVMSICHYNMLPCCYVMLTCCYAMWTCCYVNRTCCILTNHLWSLCITYQHVHLT